ncbi:odorant receptor 131-2-like [Latimeria chalumnae]|uniref:odorant receptor 131-2-like n=1 Tax=Latimeria chalumnae TaxID=7897 RepID=UPI0006D9017C|nr:PREDICTED: olfactory receptor 2A25-like [Latimeria chalumnae]|eukprot:XP_014339814.1 PREDICTED: olfactory receptor 2A25-like [Latimeria chalumnae]
MENDTSGSINGTQVAFSSHVNSFIRFTFMFAFILFSLYVFILMFQTFFSTRAFQESCCYVLFVHMLLIDTIQLLVTVILTTLITFSFNLPVPICSALILISAVTYMNTPLNLAVMSLERYVAICFPLRHAEICGVELAWIAMMIIWITGSSAYIADIILLGVLAKKSFFSTNMLFIYESLTVTSVQYFLVAVFEINIFLLVAITIVCTYIKIRLEAKKVNADKGSVSKPHKMVYLHAFQLSLCIVSFIYPLTDELLIELSSWLRQNLTYINYFVFGLFPRFLSPVIYGLRDEAFRNAMKKFLPCHIPRVIPARPTLTNG